MSKELEILEMQWRKSLAKLLQSTSVLDVDRRINVCTFLGAYGPAGYLFAVEGSPPRGIVVHEVSARRITVIGGSKTIRIDIEKYQTGAKKDMADASAALVQCLERDDAAQAKRFSTKTLTLIRNEL